MDANTLYYFFSTLAQTYGAIVGLIGMLTVYKLQRLEANLAQQYSDKKGRILKSLGNDPDHYQMEELPKLWEKTEKTLVPEDKEWNDNHYIFRDFVHFLNSILPIKKRTQDRFIHFLILNIWIIFLSLMLLLFSKPLSTTGWKYFWATIMMTFVVFSLIATIRLCLTLTELNLHDYLKRLKLNVKDLLDKWEQQVGNFLNKISLL
jgi:hypothetical protein